MAVLKNPNPTFGLTAPANIGNSLPHVLFNPIDACPEFSMGKDRSFREGQHYVFPLMLICGLLAAASTQDRLQLNALVALVPVTGSTMVLRDTLAGSFQLVPALISTVSSLALAFAALRQVARSLDDEGLFSTRGGEAEMAARRVQSRIPRSLWHRRVQAPIRSSDDSTRHRRRQGPVWRVIERSRQWVGKTLNRDNHA